jgi:hypothetical protein
MKWLTAFGVTLVVCWVIDQTMFYGQYFGVLGSMLGSVAHFFR